MAVESSCMMLVVVTYCIAMATAVCFVLLWCGVYGIVAVIVAIVAGLDVEKLFEFLVIILTIRHLEEMWDLQLFEVSHPFCREPLAVRLFSVREFRFW